VQTLIKTIYSDSTKQDEEAEGMKGLITDICDECADMLREPDRSQSKAAIKIVCSLLQTTSEYPPRIYVSVTDLYNKGSISQHVLSQNLPPLLSLFQTTPSSRRAVLSCLAELLNAIHLAAVEWKVQSSEHASIESSKTDSGGIDSYKDQILAILTVGLKASNTRQPAIRGLSNALDLDDFFTEEELGFIVHSVNEVTFEQQKETEDIDGTSWYISSHIENLFYAHISLIFRKPALKLLQKISSLAPETLETTTLPLLFGALPDVPPKTTDEREKVWRILAALEELCLPPPLFQMLLVRILAKIDIVCGIRYQQANMQSVDCTGLGREERAAYSHSLLVTLSKVLITKNARKDLDVQKYVKELFDRIYNLFILSAIQENRDKCVATHIRLLQVGAQIGALVAQALTDPYVRFR
jgi:DNA repair/transcription protein MET18/MMS19